MLITKMSVNGCQVLTNTLVIKKGIDMQMSVVSSMHMVAVGFLHKGRFLIKMCAYIPNYIFSRYFRSVRILVLEK